jgi:hypothetical protein
VSDSENGLRSLLERQAVVDTINDFHLVKEADRWLIDGFRFRLKFLDGNPDLESFG